MPHRSRRLRKKLHVDEFQQLGFTINFQLSSGITPDQSDQFWSSFIANAIEGNTLTFGGGEIGFAVPKGRTSATNAHRHLIESWLQARPEIVSVQVDPLVDAWYPDRL